MPKITIEVPEGHVVQVVPLHGQNKPVTQLLTKFSASAMLATSFKPDVKVVDVFVSYTDQDGGDDRYMADEYGTIPGTKLTDQKGVLVVFPKGEERPFYRADPSTAVYIKEGNSKTMVAWFNDRLMPDKGGPGPNSAEQIRDYLCNEGHEVTLAPHKMFAELV